jgi:hypothetical protein
LTEQVEHWPTDNHSVRIDDVVIVIALSAGATRLSLLEQEIGHPPAIFLGFGPVISPGNQPTADAWSRHWARGVDEVRE